MSKNSVDFDYSLIYNKKLKEINYSGLPFSDVELFNKLPKILPRSNYHGDLTLENVIYSTNGNFYLIDPMTTEYDSYIFDVGKLMQDVMCKWFLRDQKQYISTKLYNIEKTIFNLYPIANNNYIIILMLLRVLKNCKTNSFEHNFILSEINKLWK